MFNMLFYSFQNMLKISTCFFTVFNTLFLICFQNVLQISTHSEIFKTLSNMKIWNIYSQIVTEPFQKYFENPSKNTISMLNYSLHLKYENIKSRVLKYTYVMNNIENCVENHVENFKACWKTMLKFQSMSKITMMWLLCYPVHQFGTN